MTQVNFYTLPSPELQSRLQFVCRLTEKAYSLGHRIHILTDSQQQSKALDDMLWQYSASSFLPHCSLDSGGDNGEPVTLGTELAAATHADVLINLSTQPCASEGQFSRINEVISADNESLEQGRFRYRFYKEKAMQIETFKL
ncbi:DNA polymerase III subunit chi [Gammaproteobacteria bacterium]|jgi:DNA polymerase-3 subunit chi|nr:DNA polymerase III subunit chi [Pseudomonadales bacterium]MDC0414263.1 DNA polymerase III subunit chi [Gammaproteobacteria bacterium]